MSTHVSELCTFSPDGSIFTACSLEGCIKFWEVLTQKQQTYTPSSHLSASCTCMSWSSVKKNGHLEKSKRRSKGRESVGGVGNLVAGGTMKGDIYLYSPTECTVITQLTGGHTDKVTGLSWSSDGSALYSCSVDNNLCHWDVNKSELKRKWSDKKTNGVHSIACHPTDTNLLLTASKRIYLWDLQTLTTIGKWRGHATEVTCLRIAGKYFLSSAEGDRTISAWSFDTESEGKKAGSVGTFVLKDEVSMFDARCSTGNGQSDIILTATTKSGLLQIFKHALNKSVTCSVAAAVTLHIDSSKNGASVNGKTSSRLPLLGSYVIDDHSLLVAYGSLVKPVFETLMRKNMKPETCLVRSDPFHSKQTPADTHSTKVLTPHTPSDATVLTPGASLPVKRKKNDSKPLSMEEKLDSLIVSRKPSKAQPTMDSLAHLLIQGLRSEDKTILRNVLLREEESVISSTVQRLPVAAIQPLLTTLQKSMHKKDMQLASVRWMRVILSVHSSHLMSCPGIEDLLLPIYHILQTRASLYSSTSSLKGRLDLLVGQVSQRSKQTLTPITTPLLTYKDESSGSEDSDPEVGADDEDDIDNWEESGGDESSGSDDSPVMQVEGSDSSGSEGMEEDSDSDDG